MRKIPIKEKDYLLPDLFDNERTNDTGFKFITGDDVSSFGKISKLIRSAKSVILEDVNPAAARKLFAEIEKRIDEMIPFEERERINSRSFSRNRKREFDRIKSEILGSIFITARDTRIESFGENFEILPFLYSFCGTDPYSSDPSIQYLIPYKFYRELENCLKEEIAINCIRKNVSAGKNVLLPRSQETTELFKRSLDEIIKKSDIRVIEMGCGSGVLTILADLILNNSEIHFTDILPEALASTMLNIEKTSGSHFEMRNGMLKCQTGNNILVCRESGDLFEKIEEFYDLIIFNPPWVDAQAANRSELALNDKNQKTLERFLIQAKRRLNSGGRILLAFSDNSGEQAVLKLENLIETNGLTAEKEVSEKVQSYQSGRKWMRIFVKTIKVR
jgi:methylase of polypeptide subunit release factors